MFDAFDKLYIVEGKKYIKASRKEYIKTIARFLNRNTGITIFEEMHAAIQTLLDHPSVKGRPSSNGRTTDFGSVNRGSNPCGLTIKHKYDSETFLEVSSNEHLHPEYDWDHPDEMHWDFWKD